ncbi:MAG TPA: ABC transporter ATP-binding protein [Planctomycetaceae bacterium]|nr:ABC transporter ATP-binding protein [Planctomycetaceae bacterium]
MTTIIEANAVRKRFGRNEVLRGTTLAIPRGAIVGLVGTNGAGKSTLIKCLLGLLRPDSGTVQLFGEDSWTLSAESKGRLGYVPQIVQLYPWMKVDQVVRYVAAFYPHWDGAWSNELLDRWELPRDHRVGPLSPGQMQKLGLVLALGHRPDLLILDEPVAALDPVARREFLRAMMEVTNDAQHTVLFSTHITSDLERVASHVALLRDGQIALFEELDAVKDRVKRLRIRAAENLPANFHVRGALRVTVDGANALAAVTDLDDRMVDELSKTWHAEVSVEDLNLEDIFLELHHVAR